MFNLVLSVIAVALVLGLALTSVFYGGSIFSDASAKNEAARLMNGAQQIKAALDLYKIDNAGMLPAEIDILTDGVYLKANPDGDWFFGDGYAVNPVAEEDVCLEVNEKYGFTDPIPSCDADPYPVKAVCCEK